MLLVLGFLIALSISQASVCPFTVINPTCSNGTQSPTDYSYPCLSATNCMNASLQHDPVDCENWMCSLRINCGCFAGQDTSCANNNSACSKSGCSLIVDMFNQVGCNYSTFLGPRNSTKVYSTYINQCLLGCNSAKTFSLSFPFLCSISVLLLVL